MSYDFTPTHHIGMTAGGSLIATRRKKVKTKPRQGAFVEHDDGALRLECIKGNKEAITEYEYRLCATRHLRK